MGNKISITNTFVHIIIIIIFFILIISLIWTNSDTFDNLGNIIKHSHDNIIHKLKGSKYYHSLSSHENLENKLRNKNECIIFFMAPWCKVCKKLENENILKIISKTKSVIKISDKHPDAPLLMNTFEMSGFPEILIFKNKKLTKFDKKISVENLLQELK